LTNNSIELKPVRVAENEDGGAGDRVGRRHRGMDDRGCGQSLGPGIQFRPVGDRERQGSIYPAGRPTAASRSRSLDGVGADRGSGITSAADVVCGHREMSMAGAATSSATTCS